MAVMSSTLEIGSGPITPQNPHIAAPPIANRRDAGRERRAVADSIRMRGIQLPVALGVSAGERSLRRPVEIDLDLHCDLARSGSTDDLTDTIDYVAVWETLAKVASAEFRLVEALAERICAELFASFRTLEQVRIEVRKLAPLPGAVRTAGVELTRLRRR